jgi:hypothetical protein
MKDQACGIIGGSINKRSPHCWPQYILAKVYVDTILVACLAEIRGVGRIAYWETNLSVSSLEMTVARGNVANFFLVKKLGIFV